MTNRTSTNGELLDLDELKRHHPLEDEVRRSGVELRGRGRVLQARCPFHDDRVPSFTVYCDSERFYCFGCGAKGDVIDFVRLRDGVGFPVAVRELENLPRFPSLQGSNRTPSARWHTANGTGAANVSAPDPAVLSAAMDFYAKRLADTPEAQAYLMSRGAELGVDKLLGLGYSDGKGLMDHLVKLDFTGDAIRSSGLLAGHGRERFEGMIVVPEVRRGKARPEQSRRACPERSRRACPERSRRAVWLTGRAIDSEAERRFQSLPGPKPLLGLGALEEGMPVILTEGLFDWIVLRQWGLNAAATLGTHVPDETLRPLTACHRVFVVYDNDDAGHDAAKRAVAFLGVKRAAPVALPRGVKDVADLALKPDGVEAFLRSLAEAERAVYSCARSFSSRRSSRAAAARKAG